MNAGKAITIYLIMLMTHIAHVFEELWGNFIALEVIGSSGLFLLINWVAFGLVMLLLRMLLLQKRWAYTLGIVYAAVMTVNGLMHGIGFITTGEYFGGFAGCVTGVPLMVLGPTLIYYVRREMPSG